MEKKTTQRIIGMLVVIALVIILLPLLFSKNELITQTAENKSQPMLNDSNDQSIQLSSNTSDSAQAQTTPALASNSSQAAPANSAAPQSESTQPLQDASAANASQNANNSVDISPSVAATVNNSVAPVQGNDFQISDSVASIDTSTSSSATGVDTVVSANSPATNNPAAPAANASNNAPATSDVATNTNTTTDKQTNVTLADANNASMQKTDGTTADATAKSADVKKEEKADKKAKVKKEKSKKEKSAKTTTAQNDKNVKDALLKLKKAAWVIQMGSFNDKSNATRLADKLRIAGYKAFIHEVTSSKTGKVSTRVYIGPEDQQASAQQLSSRVEQELNLHGIVVSFKPLEL